MIDKVNLLVMLQLQYNFQPLSTTKICPHINVMSTEMLKPSGVQLTLLVLVIVNMERLWQQMLLVLNIHAHPQPLVLLAELVLFH
jgi:hypothetical protein